MRTRWWLKENRTGSEPKRYTDATDLYGKGVHFFGSFGPEKKKDTGVGRGRRAQI